MSETTTSKMRDNNNKLISVVIVIISVASDSESIFFDIFHIRSYSPFVFCILKF